MAQDGLDEPWGQVAVCKRYYEIDISVLSILINGYKWDDASKVTQYSSEGLKPRTRFKADHFNDSWYPLSSEKSNLPSSLFFFQL